MILKLVIIHGTVHTNFYDGGKAVIHFHKMQSFLSSICSKQNHRKAYMNRKNNRKKEKLS